MTAPRLDAETAFIYGDKMVAYDDATFLGFLVKRALRPALNYLAQFPEKQAELQRYQRRFEQVYYGSDDVKAEPIRLLLIFQQYYREVFYCNAPEPVARKNIQSRFTQCLQTGNDEFGTILEPKIKKSSRRMARLFVQKLAGLHFPGTCRHRLDAVPIAQIQQIPQKLFLQDFHFFIV